MNLFKTLIFSAFLCPLFSMAQANYQPGYIIKMNGDTVKGYIDMREWNSNPNAISFKKALNAVTENYTPTDILSFADNKTIYKRYAGPISMDNTNTDHLATGRDSSIKVGEVFLQRLLTGKNMTLYSYTDDIKTRFFVSEAGDAAIKELRYAIYVTDNYNGISYTKTDQTYLRQLNAIAMKYNTLTEDLTHKLIKADYDKSSMMQIAAMINNISVQDYKAKYAEKNATHFYAGIGASYVNIKHEPGTGYDAAGGKDATSLLPMLTVGLQTYVNPNTERVALGLEFNAALIQYSSRYNSQISPHININYSFKSIAFSIAPLITYNFYNAKDLAIYFGGGARLMTFAYFGKEYKNTADGTMAPTQAHPFAFKSLNIPAVIKAGFIINKKYNIDLSYATSYVISDDYVFTLNAHGTVAVSVNYRF